MNTIYGISLLLTVFLATFFFPHAVHSQLGPMTYNIRGIVADSATGKPMEFVTLVLLTDSNQTSKIGYSYTNGLFELSGIQPAIYSLKLSMVGYQTKAIPIVLTDTTDRNKDLGIIYLSSQTIGLDEVVVEASKPIIRQEVDRISYDLQADPDSKVSSVLEMMRKVPFLSLDAQENILLKGNSNYRIFINGKPSGMVEGNPKDVLRSMPASTIERIEVITTPSAKYDAEGTAGIINIVTTKKPDSGYKGSVNINERFPVGGPGIGGSVSAQMGKLGMSAIGGVSLYNTPRTNNALIRTTSGLDQTSLVQTGSSLSNKRSGYLGFEGSYEINDHHLVTSQFNINGSRTSYSDNQLSSLTDQATLLQGYDLARMNLNKGYGIDAALNYQIGFQANKDRILTFSYRYYSFADQQKGKVTLDNQVNFELPDFQQLNDEHFGEQSFQVDYVSPLGKLEVETGLKAILRKNNSHFEYWSFDAENGQFELKTAFSNQYNYNQQVLSAYNSYQYNLNEWSFRAGLRAEITLIDADFVSSSSQVNQQYANLIPSFALSRKFKNNSALKLGLVRQISRPSIKRLNPFVDRSNPNVEISGNPNLRPHTFSRLQLGYGFSGKASVNMGLDYTFVRNIDFRITTFDPATNITRNTFDNTGKADALDFSFNGQYPLTKNWNISVNGMVTHLWAEVGGDQLSNKTQMFQYSATASTSYRFQKEWRFNASLNVLSPSFRSPQEKANGLIGSSFSVTKDIITDKLLFSGLISNPFTTFRTNLITTTSPEFTQLRSSRDYFRSVNISLNYSFGKLKGTIKKNKRGIKNDDLTK